MTPTDNKYLAEIKARVDAATEGPWKFNLITDAPEPFYWIEGFHKEKGLKQDSSDCEFVAHARTDIPKLLAMVQERDADYKAICKEMDEERELNERLLKQLEVAKDALNTVRATICTNSSFAAVKAMYDCADKALAELDRLENEKPSCTL